MPSELSSARRYAQAALELALAEGEDGLDRWQADLEVLGRVWADARQRRYLDDQRMSHAVLIARARQVLASHIGPLALNLVLVLISRGRAHLIPLVVQQFGVLRDQRERRAHAEVISALPLTDEQRRQIEARLSAESGQQVTVTNAVDPAILGGLVIRQGDRLIDASVATKLRRLQAQIATEEQRML
jgi:F-type H+-transporting ATPase subunit delta